MNCLLCGRPMRQEQTVMALIYPPVPNQQQVVCDRCREQFVPATQSKESFTEWQSQIPLFKHFALYAYQPLMKEWLNRYKIQGDYALRQVLAEEVAYQLRPLVKDGWTLLPIPIDSFKWQKRGFNQVIGVLEAAHLPYVELLVKKPTDKPQGLKNREERLQMPQCFTLNPNIAVNDRYVIVDDIYTTGRTITRAYQLLIAAGVTQLQSFSFLLA